MMRTHLSFHCNYPDTGSIERFWRSAKCERISQTLKDLQKDIDDDIAFYNHPRFHKKLKYKNNTFAK